MKTTTVRVLEWALWAVAAASLGTVAHAKWQTARTQAVAFERIEAGWHVPDEPVRVETAPDRTLWSEARRRAFDRARDAAQAPMPEAVLSIASIGLEVAVFAGTSDHVLNVGVGHVSGTARAGEHGNIALAGHRDGFFRRLKDVAIGDEIVLRGRHGQDRYRIAATTIVTPDDVSVLEPTDDGTLTLITCYPFYFVGDAPQRFIVRAEIVD